MLFVCFGRFFFLVPRRSSKLPFFPFFLTLDMCFLLFFPCCFWFCLLIFFGFRRSNLFRLGAMATGPDDFSSCLNQNCNPRNPTYHRKFSTYQSIFPTYRRGVGKLDPFFHQNWTKTWMLPSKLRQKSHFPTIFPSKLYNSKNGPKLGFFHQNLTQTWIFPLYLDQNLDCSINTGPKLWNF